VRLRRFVDRAVERSVVDHVRDCAPHVEALPLQPGRLRRDCVAVDVDQGDARSVRREHLAVREPEPAGASRDDDPEIAHFEP